MKYSQEIKEKVISDYNSGIKASIISKNTNISKSTIYKWLNEKPSTTPLPISHRESQKLIRKVQRFETMLEIIQNTDFFKQIPFNIHFPKPVLLMITQLQNPSLQHSEENVITDTISILIMI